VSVVTCPYCRSTHGTGELLLNCARCGDAAQRFPAAGLRRGRCPHGRLPQARRSCPACEHDLPREYVDTASRTIAVIGSTRSGKSTWIATVIRQFAKGEVAERFPGMSLDLLGEHSRLRYRNEFERGLLSDAAHLYPTITPARNARAEPLLLSLRLRPGSRPVVIVLYDAAGEDLSTARIAARSGAAGGILLMVDPMQLPRIRQVMAIGQPHTDLEPCFARLCFALREELRLPERRKFATPLAIGLAKVDTVWDMFEESPMRLPSPHSGRYVEADGLDVHHEVRSWLGHWFVPELIRDVAENFPVHRYFGFSALGRSSTGRSDVSSYRVEDPLLWFMARFGAIKTRRGRR
jgi:hypothetical protein